MSDTKQVVKIDVTCAFLRCGAGGTVLHRCPRNAARCKLCGDVIESKHRHDFVTCSCGNVSVDGGTNYHKRAFKSDEWEEA